MKWFLAQGVPGWKITRGMKLSRTNVREIKAGVTYRGEVAVEPNELVKARVQGATWITEKWAKSMQSRKRAPFIPKPLRAT